MRLIDADAIKLEKGFFENIDNVPKFFEWLGKQPTIDAVPVVRCRDCKYSYIEERTLVCGLRGFFVREDFFCVDGERRENGDECMR